MTQDLLNAEDLVWLQSHPEIYPSCVDNPRLFYFLYVVYFLENLPWNHVSLFYFIFFVYFEKMLWITIHVVKGKNGILIYRKLGSFNVNNLSYDFWGCEKAEINNTQVFLEVKTMDVYKHRTEGRIIGNRV